jgi:hypothetical protein
MNFIDFKYPDDWEIEGWIMNSTMEANNGKNGR